MPVQTSEELTVVFEGLCKDLALSVSGAMRKKLRPSGISMAMGLAMKELLDLGEEAYEDSTEEEKAIVRRNINFIRQGMLDIMDGKDVDWASVGAEPPA